MATSAVSAAAGTAAGIAVEFTRCLREQPKRSCGHGFGLLATGLLVAHGGQVSPGLASEVVRMTQVFFVSR